MVLEEIDRLLADWKNKLDLISQNLIDLCGLLTYQRLSGAAGFSPVKLTGISKTKIEPVLEALNELFQHFDLLTQTIDKARSLRASIPRFLGSEPKAQEILQILTATSIQLPAIRTPLAQRELLSAAETIHAITPTQLLVAMAKTFEVVKESVVAVDLIWSDLEPQLDRAEAEIATIQRQGESLGAIDLRELEASRQAIAALRDRIETDPLGTRTSFEDIERLTAKMRSDLDQLVRAQAKLNDGFTHAKVLLKRLIALNQEAIAAFAESQEKITDCADLFPPLPLEYIEAVGQWLQRLESKLKEGLSRPVRVGLENCTTKISEYIAIETKNIAANRRSLQTRQELRGRLDALKAKAIAKGYAEDMQLAKLADQAKQLLYTRPTPLNQAEETVKQYEIMLNSKSKAFG
ncbi:hypothetical protein V2H45_07970 [Tumidithrix elongata RA019]|uniref:Uncharacterized protein n=1 Tax=Tumidithrix elongata BACA0141 TaxID=2716417 RepID=A0AAW9Q0E4_9CYAN|nr:hypothetical protein [Tumidithrix elongata RA019]